MLPCTVCVSKVRGDAEVISGQGSDRRRGEESLRLHWRRLRGALLGRVHKLRRGTTTPPSRSKFLALPEKKPHLPARGERHCLAVKDKPPPPPGRRRPVWSGLAASRKAGMCARSGEQCTSFAWLLFKFGSSLGRRRLRCNSGSRRALCNRGTTDGGGAAAAAW